MFPRHLLDLILYRTRAELAAEANRSYAGMAWWIVDPLLALAVYYTVFGFLISHKEASYVAFLFIGIITWKWFQNCVQHSANSLISQKPLMLLVNVHKSIFTMSGILADSVKFLISLLVCLALVAIACHSVSLAWLALPAVVLTELLFLIGCCLIVAAITPFLPDINLLLPSLLQLLMFLSGVFYRVDAFPPQIQRLIRLNPMTPIVEQYREVLMYHRFPNWLMLGMISGVGVILIAVGGALIHRFDKVYPKLA